MKNLKKKYSIKIPKNIQIFYCDKKNIITFSGPLLTKSLKLKIKIFLIPSSSLIIASEILTEHKSVTCTKDIKKLQGTTIACDKKLRARMRAMRSLLLCLSSC
jgi:hypothetical protein